MKKLFSTILFLLALVAAPCFAATDVRNGVDQTGEAYFSGAVAITGGTIDGVTIGGTSPAIGIFTTLTVNTLSSMPSTYSISAAGGVNFYTPTTVTGNFAATTYGSDSSVLDAELLYINTLSSNAQTQLDARCLESVFGDTISSDFALNGTSLETHAALHSIVGLTETEGGLLTGSSDANAYSWVAAGAEGTLLMGNGAAAPSFLAAGTSGYLLVAAGAADPVWTATLPVANGGTGTSTAPAAGQVLVASSSTVYTPTGTTGTGDVVRANTPTLITPEIGAATGTSLALTTLSTMPGAYSISAAGGAQFYTNVTVSGNVGIGTTEPGYKLEVYGAAGTKMGINDGTASTWLETGGGISLLKGNAGSLGIYTSGGERLRISTTSNISARMTVGYAIGTTLASGNSLAINGNVGIGTTAPSRELQVVGVISASQWIGAGQYFSNADRSATSPEFGNMAETAGMFFSSGALGLSTGDTERLRITTDGNVGIGTTNAFGGGSRILAIATCTIEPYSATAGAGSFFYTGNEMWVANEALTKTQLSTHPESGYVELDLPTYHGFRSKIPLLGKEVSGDITATVSAVERLMKQVFGEDVKYQTFSDLPASELITPEQYFASRRVEIEEKLRKELSTEVEVSLADAIEIVQIDVDEEIEVLEQSVDETGKTITYKKKQKVIESETVSYEFKDGEIKEVKTPIYKKTKISKKQLKAGHRLDTKTGKLYQKQLPSVTVLNAAVAVEMERVKLPNYVSSKLN